jgi:hypothetical protein
MGDKAREAEEAEAKACVLGMLIGLWDSRKGMDETGLAECLVAA